MPPSNSIEDFQKLVRSSKHILVVAGAGLSAASGIPTFRGKGGYWRNLDATKLATPEAFAENPSLVWQFYHYRREVVERSKPNNAHRVLAALCVPHLLRQLAPTAQSCHLITQNVDGLSIQAIDDLTAKLKPSKPSKPYKSSKSTKSAKYAKSPKPSKPSTEQPADPKGIIIEMHGRLFDVKCTTCDWVELDYTSPLCPALGKPTKMSDLKDMLVRDEDTIAEEDLPRCKNPECGKLARPGVVWFGEQITALKDINPLLSTADLCIVVGTSSTVYPAGGFAYQVQHNGGRVAVFNLEDAEGSDDADFLFIGGCEETLGRAIGVPEEWVAYGIEV